VSRHSLFRILLLAAVALWVSAAHADIRFRNFEDPDAPQWQEDEVQLPAFPKDENLISFDIGAATSNRFFIDGSTISPGKDGVVRYTLVIRTSGGATNVSFEGLRCGTRELRIYATGRADGQWARARISEWKRIESKAVNRHHAELSRTFFCAGGAEIATGEEGKDALIRGKHPLAP
jgi:hypothetical protein